MDATTILSNPGLTGQSCQQLTEAYTKASNRPWTQPIGFQHALFEVAIDVLKRAKNLSDPKSILDCDRGHQLPVDRRTDPVDRRAGEECHQDAIGRGAMAAQERKVRSGDRRKQDRAEYSGRRKAAADFADRSPMAPILALETVSKRFGAVVVADGIDLALNEGEALGIIGPNGAGKTTLFGIATGTVAPDSGRVLFAGET